MQLRHFKAAAIALFASALFPSIVAACSVCRCGDPTFNALGTNIFTAGQFHLALDYATIDFDKPLSPEQVAEAELLAELAKGAAT